MIREIIVCCAVLFIRTEAFSAGAPSLACATMTPQHSGTNPMELSESRFEVEAVINSENEVSVTVSGPAFRGLLLQGRTTEEGEIQGSWLIPEGDNFQHLGCNSQPFSAVTHTSNVDKLSGEFIWIPPEVNMPTNFTIFATFVAEFSVYFVMVPSSVITITPEMSETFSTALPSTTEMVVITGEETQSTVRIPSESETFSTTISSTTEMIIVTGEETQSTTRITSESASMANTGTPLTTTSGANNSAPNFVIWSILCAGILSIQINNF